MKIFIGSSTEEQVKVYKIIEKINDINCEYECLPWFNAFSASEYTMESLISISKDVDCAIFIFAGDDKVNNSRGEFTKARDNVVLECGLFIGALDLRNVAIVCKEKVDIPSDLKGITNIFMNEDFESTLRKWFNNISKSGNIESVIEIDNNNDIKVLHKDLGGYYYSSIIDRRYRTAKNGKKYIICRLDGIIDIVANNLVNGESHWLCYEDGRFPDLTKINKVKFKIQRVDELKEFNKGEKTRNIYVSEVIGI